jgi:hypothetical protein
VVAFEEPERSGSPEQVVLASFERYLLAERALATGTVRGMWATNARRFLGVLDANYPAGAHASTWLRLPASSRGAIDQSTVVAPND